MKKILLAIMFSAFVVVSVSAQTTAFTYQGSLKDGTVNATGNYDFEFKLYDLASGGVQQGSTLQRLNVSVTNGIFAVSLDFGAVTLPGADRFLEIGLKPAGNPGGFQQLLPRHSITSAPYSVRSLNSTTSDVATNATQLGGVAANQYVVTTDPRMTDPRSPTAGSANYIQNGTSQQATSNFNVSGDGTAAGTLSGGVVNAATQYNLAGNRILSAAGSFNFFAGVSAGAANTTGNLNAFFGRNAGQNNTTGSLNSFFGTDAGRDNTTGNLNSFFGQDAGLSSTGSENAFFGDSAGRNTTGNTNAFIGRNSGLSNTIGNSNTALGYLANFGSNNLNFATAIGANSVASQSNSIYLGRPGGEDTVRVPGTLTGNVLNTVTQLNVNGLRTLTVNGPYNNVFALAASNTFTGEGTGLNTTPDASLTSFIGKFNSFFGSNAGVTNTTGYSNSFFGSRAGLLNTTGSGNSFFGLQAGSLNTSGSSNAFFGYNAGEKNNGDNNALFGYRAGSDNTTGMGNTFVGYNAGNNNSTGSNNTTLGYSSGFTATNLTYATAIGSESTASLSNSVFIGRDGGEDTVRIPGNLNITGATTMNGNFVFAAGGAASINGPNIFMPSLNAGIGTNLCLSSNRVITCSSSLRYKTNIGQFNDGLNLVARLKPITFDWKIGGMKDIGFGAEDVAKIDPRFVTYNSSGEVEGVKYDRLSVAFVNAFKEQQAQIERQQSLIEKQQDEIENLKAVVCSIKPDAELCKK